MLWLLILGTLSLALAPVRRYWYIVLPAAAGIALGLNFAGEAVGGGAPGLLVLLAPLMAAAMLVGFFREAFGGRSAPTGNDRRDNDRRDDRNNRGGARGAH